MHIRLRHLPRQLALIGLLVLSPIARSHQADEYEQETLVAIGPTKIDLSLKLTPGIDVVDEVLLMVETNSDDTIDPKEAAAYGELLRHNLFLRLDGHPLDLKLTNCEVPQPGELRSGLATIEAEFSASPDPLAGGPHALVLDNRHLPKVSSYVIRTDIPKSASIRITGQTRTHTQGTSQIDFSFDSPAPARPPSPDSRKTLIAAIAAILTAATALFVRNRRGRVAKHLP